MHTRPIPSTGARLPVIGCGTWLGFDVGGKPQEMPQRGAVLAGLFDAGGSVVDSSPMYGSAEQVVGDLLQAPERATGPSWRPRYGPAASAPASSRWSARWPCCAPTHIDLMQVHNLQDWRTHLATLRDWKAAGRISYIGMTHYTDSAHPELEQVMRAEPLDFVQFNYSIANRAAEKRLLPLAAERGIAVLINLPFGGGKVLQGVAAAAAAGMGAGDRLRQLEPVAAEIRAVAAGRDLRDPRHLASRTHARQRRRRHRRAARSPASGRRACPTWAFERDRFGVTRAALRSVPRPRSPPVRWQ